ncbi:hypothetical protein [Lysobacter gummosus]|uniref:hypothetical protein n=1 Tax=Lysobacter gummosus TaxID=262324 RepID=UPI0036416A41
MRHGTRLPRGRGGAGREEARIIRRAPVGVCPRRAAWPIVAASRIRTECPCAPVC